MCLRREPLCSDWWNSPAEMRFCMWLANSSQMAQVRDHWIGICWWLPQFSPHFIVFIHFITIILGHLKTRNERHSTDRASTFTNSSKLGKINTLFDSTCFVLRRHYYLVGMKLKLIKVPKFLRSWYFFQTYSGKSAMVSCLVFFPKVCDTHVSKTAI